MASEAEAVELAELVASEADKVIAEATEALEVVADITGGADIINVSKNVDIALELIHEERFAATVAEELPIEINNEITEAVDSVASGLENAGIDVSEISSAAGSKLSKCSALGQAERDLARASTGLWARLQTIGGITLKIAEIYIAIDFVGKMFYEIVTAIQDATKNPQWKGSLTEPQKAQLIKLQDATDSLRPLMESWESALKPLQDNVLMSYGTMTATISGREEVVQVIDVVAYVIQDAIQQIIQANNTVKDGIEGLTVFDLSQLSNYIFGAFADAQATVDLRDNKNNIVKDNQLKVFKFPAEADDKEVNRVLNTDFPEWKDKVKSQAFSLAKIGAGMATSAFTKSQVIMKVNSYLRENIFPQIKTAAKEAGQKAAKDYVKGEMGKIILKALIPIVGPQEARNYGKEVQNKAIEQAKEAAIAAGKKKADELQSCIESTLKPVVQNVMDANKDQIKAIAVYAAKQILNTVVSPV